MDKNQIIRSLLVLFIILTVGVSSYLILKPNSSQVASNNQGDLAPIVDGKQLVKMTVLGVQYDPNYFKVRVGVPVKWEIASSGQSGCASGAIIARGLIDDVVYLNPEAGQVMVKEFTPSNTGKYSFTCPMGMARGTIEVVN